MRVWCGGEALRADVAQELVARSREVWNMYGPTETTVWSTTRRIRGQEERIVVGRGIANTQVYVLDAAGELVPWGRIGEVYLGGAGLAQGYLGNREQTAARFVPDGYGKQAGGRLYRTGDLGRWTQAGDLEIVGRADQQVKLRGYRIELGEIETVLRGVAGVREAVVVLWEERLVAYLVRAEQEEGPTNQQVRAWVRERLPEYMQPSQLVWIDALPVTANGKLDRRALPAPSVEQERGAQREEHEEDPLEGLVQQIWESVLHREGIGRRENFFELGGHSLLATQVMARVRSRLQVELPLRSLFEAPTIAGLGHQVQKALREQQGLAVAPPLVPVAREHRLPLSFAQQRLWFLDQLFPDRAQAASYLICLAVQFQGALSIEALERSLSALMARHESLRTMLVSEQGEPWQEIKATGRPELLVVDLTGLAQEVREEQSRRLLQEEQTVPCSLREGPLWRTRVLRQGGQEHLLVMTLHHSIVDGWSLSVLQRELVAFYRAEVRGEEARLLRLPIQYGDYALWQRTWLQGEVLEEHVRYWRERLRGARGFQAPVDHPRSGQGSGRGGSVGVMFSAEVSAQIKEGARQEGVTVFMFLLAAFQVLLSRWSGQEDIVVGTDIANRTREETEGLIGFFVNLLALRTQFVDAPTFREVLGRVRESVLGAYMHQDIPFEKLIESLKLERETHQTPLVHVLFVLQNVPEEPLEALEGISAQVVRSETTSAKFELALFLQEGPRGLQGRIVYNKDLFEQATIERLSKWYQTLLNSAISAPDSPVDMLEYSPAEENLHGKDKKNAKKMKALEKLRSYINDKDDINGNMDVNNK
jgi:Condensation domain/AMP-binding enzyme/AMP-binding enzyme C-terminal domain/Phosphopantetheine attachment site